MCGTAAVFVAVAVSDVIDTWGWEVSSNQSGDSGQGGIVNLESKSRLARKSVADVANLAFRRIIHCPGKG